MALPCKRQKVSELFRAGGASSSTSRSTASSSTTAATPRTLTRSVLTSQRERIGTRENSLTNKGYLDQEKLPVKVVRELSPPRRDKELHRRATRRIFPHGGIQARLERKRRLAMERQRKYEKRPRASRGERSIMEQLRDQSACGKDYEKRILEFEGYCEEHGLRLRTSQELDEAFTRTRGLQRATCEALLADFQPQSR